MEEAVVVLKDHNEEDENNNNDKEKSSSNGPAKEVFNVEISTMRISDGKRQKREKQRLWLKRPMTARLVFHGKNSERKMVILEGRAPAQATKDGTRLVKVRQSTISTHDIDFVDEKREVTCPCLLGQEALFEMVNDQNEDEDGTIAPGTRVVANTFSPVAFGETALERSGGRWAGTWGTHALLTSESFLVQIPEGLSEFAATTAHTMALAWAACRDILERDEPATIVVQGAGLLGLYCCAILSRHAFSVFCTEKSSKRLRLVTEFGGVPLHPSLAGPIDSKASTVIECCGDSLAPSQAYNWMGTGSRYIIMGLSGSAEKISLSGAQIIKKGITLMGVDRYTNEDLASAVEFLSLNQSRYPWHKLAGPNFDLHEWESAFRKWQMTNFDSSEKKRK
ncbi:Oidioi.mRNA.OKI2018_I69.chr1.g3125.t1.cds [Oikopleura dioica]|uniref:Oidioi.mRNA.OKI2018_I69.chr1.g3125.t1.cds n=1 Tax=Oikopleura dioica TaxID=34765 RepID=A0ABN7SXJ3_OIKDI|nr:Oidioi.mRNA.OKI2018_I69.chr1.g3125.t1.cds [Oikopleura dioica]